MRPPKPVEAIILDMDGTLHDTEPVYRRAMQHAMADVGFTVNDAFCNALVGIPEKETDQVIRERLGAGFPLTDFRRRYWRYCETSLATGITLKPGALRLLDYIAGHRLPHAIATSASRKAALSQLALSGLATRFGVVVTRDDVTRGKPYPDIYLEAARRLAAVAERCLAVEDSFPGIRAAHDAGMMTVMVPDQLTPNPEIRKDCTFVLPDLDEVLDLLREDAVAQGAGRFTPNRTNRTRP